MTLSPFSDEKFRYTAIKPDILKYIKNLNVAVSSSRAITDSTKYASCNGYWLTLIELARTVKESPTSRKGLDSVVRSNETRAKLIRQNMQSTSRGQRLIQDTRPNDGQDAASGPASLPPDLERSEIHVEPFITYNQDSFADFTRSEGEEEDDDENSNSQFPQPLDLFHNSLYRSLRQPTYHPQPRSHRCPYCRQEARLVTNPGVHADTIQLLRVRLRLSDLAYACYGFARRRREEADRSHIINFLDRRVADNIGLDDRETVPSYSQAKRIFKVARFSLREAALQFLLKRQHPTVQVQHVLQLVAFFENIKLQDVYEFWFDPGPRSVDKWNIDSLINNIRLLYTDPRAYCDRLRLIDHEPVGHVGDENDYDMDVKMQDAP
ncbi:MAG: hypothetical protein Q9212_002390 [Teloschistes hypoglaucus]